MKKFGLLAVAILVAGCQATTPYVEYASENVISLRYSAFDTGLTVTPQAIDMAIIHCDQFGKFANYKGGNAANIASTEEIHNFACEVTKTDDGAAIAKATESRMTSVYVF